MFKTKTKLSTRIMSIFMSLLMAASMLTVLMSVQPTEEVSAANDYGLADNIQDGAILHCFDWKYNDIKAELQNIAEAGFSAIQTSPAQVGGGSGTWWWLYQPLGFYVGNNDLGTKDELKALCAEADTYGIKVVVDVVANHLAGDHSNIQNDLKDGQYWHNESGGIDYSNRWQITHRDIGMPDINSENSYVQQVVKNYLLELKSLGVDGIRWDAAKHISLPSESCNFWPTVTEGTGLWHYGEILDEPVANNPTLAESLMQEYSKYISFTDSGYCANVRMAFRSNEITSSIGNFSERGVSKDKLVYWAESHDTYSNDKADGNWDSSQFISQNKIDRAYAVIASQGKASALYFSRPFETSKNSIKAGVKGSTHFTSPEVAEVNKFKNAMIGQKEYDTTGDNCSVVCREKGAVIVAGNGGNKDVTVPNGGGLVAPGTYTDQVSGNTWTVTSTTISGKIGDTGIAVVYNPTDNPIRSSVSASPATGTTFTTDTLSVTLSAKNVTNAKYTTSEGKSGSYKDGQKITVGASTVAGGTVKLSLSGTKADGTTVTAKYTYTKKDATAVTTIYFDNSSYNWSSVYAYIYTGDGSTSKCVAAWPGATMTKDSATGYYKLEVPSGFENGRVIFSESANSKTNRYPANMQPGLDIGGSSKIFKAGNTWENYTVTPPATDPVVTADKASGSSFTTETYDVTLGLSNAVSGTYSVDNGPTKTFTSSTKVTIGEGKIGDSDVTIKATATDSKGKTKNYTFTYKKVYVKKTSSTKSYTAKAAARAVAATAATTGTLSNSSLAKYYSTNGKGVGKEATITIDGDFSDWSEDMLIAQGAAWDVANHYKGGHENCVLDTYALYAAWDNDNLYVAWQMVNTTDTWAREGDGPLSDGGRVLDVPLILALSIDPNSTPMSNKNTTGGPIWGKKMGLKFDSTTSHVDRLLYMSGKPGLGKPSIFKAVDANGNTDYEDGCVGFKDGGIEYKMAEGNICSSIMGLNGSVDPSDVCNNGADWVDYKTFSGSSGTHNTKYDSFYEIKIPFSTLGITKDYITNNGIGAMFLATRGESALDCVPFDVSMLDNTTGDYAADPSTSAEKDDIDVITAPLANVGKGSITPPPPPQGLPLQVNFGADRSAPQEAGTALTLKGIGYGGSETGYKYEFIVDGKTVQASSSKDSYTWNLTSGKHTIKCIITDSKGATATTTKTYTAEGGTNPELPLANNSTISATSIKKGSSVTMTAKATGGKAPYKYRYFCKPEGASGWTALTGTTTATSFTHKPARAISYQYAVKVADSKGKTSTKYFTVKVSATATLKNASTISATAITKGQTVTMTAKATGGTAPYKYRYFCKPEGASGWTALTGTTTETSYTHKPARAISYQYAVKVADSKGKTSTKYFTVKVSATATLKNASTISATAITKGQTVTMTAKATGGTAPYKYRYFCKPEGASGWTALTRTTTATSYTHKPARAISYQYAVKVADSTGKTVTKYFTVNVK